MNGETHNLKVNQRVGNGTGRDFPRSSVDAAKAIVEWEATISQQINAQKFSVDWLLGAFSQPHAVRRLKIRAFVEFLSRRALENQVVILEKMVIDGPSSWLQTERMLNTVEKNVVFFLL